MGKNEIVKQLAERIDGNITEETMRKYSEVCDTLVDIFTDALIEYGSQRPRREKSEKSRDKSN